MLSRIKSDNISTGVAATGSFVTLRLHNKQQSSLMMMILYTHGLHSTTVRTCICCGKDVNLVRLGHLRRLDPWAAPLLRHLSVQLTC